MMLQPKHSAANPMLEGKVKPLAKAIGNSNTSHLHTVPVPEHLSAECRSVTIAGLERELGLPETVLPQDLNLGLESWLAAYPRRDKPLKNNFCVYDPEIDYSKVYAFATKNSQAAKNTDRVSKEMPPEWENPNPVKGWHGQRCPTIMDLLNHAEKSADWELERYTYWLEKYCVLSPERQVDPTVSANEDIHELDTLGFNDKIWYVNENLRYQSWLMWNGPEYASQQPSSGLEAFFEHIPHDVEDEYELLQIKLSDKTAYPPNPLEAIYPLVGYRRAFRAYVTPEPYVYRNPLKIYLHAVKRWHERGKGSPERLVRLYVHLGIQPAFFTPMDSTSSPVEDEKEEEEVEECNFVLVGPPRDVFVEKVAQEVRALAPPEQKYIPSTEDIDELSENLAHGMYFSQSIARVIAKHV